MRLTVIVALSLTTIAAWMEAPLLAKKTDVFTALPAQLGLKLAASTTVVRTVVVDRIEKPTEN